MDLGGGRADGARGGGAVDHLREAEGHVAWGDLPTTHLRPLCLSSCALCLPSASPPAPEPRTCSAR